LRCPDTLFGLHHSRYCLGRSRVWVGGWVGGKGIFSGCLQVVFKKNDRYCCTCATKGLWMNLQWYVGCLTPFISSVLNACLIFHCK
jgi:hypothetical protein